MNISEQEKKHGLTMLVSVGITILYFVLVMHKYSFRLQSDDAQMRAIASGAFTGSPDGHLVFIKYVLGWVISSLYKIFGKYNCYGIFFALIIACTMSFFCKFFLDRKKIGFVILYCILFTIAGLPLLIELNFTYSAAIVGSVALFLQITNEDENALGKIYFVLSIWLCYCIREEVFWVIMCFLALDIVYKYMERRQEKKHILKKYLIVLLLIFITIIIEKVAYSDQEWNSYLQYNNYRSQIVDFNDWPSYEDNKDIYLKHGINEQNYDLLDVTRLSIPDVDMEGLVKDLSKVLDEKQSNSVKKKIITACYQMYNDFFSDNYGLLNLMIGIVFGACFFYACINEQRRYYIWKIAFSFLGFLSMWFILIYNGRAITRVCYMLQFVMFTFFLAELYVINENLTIQKERYIPISMLYVVILGFIAINRINGVNDISIQNEKINNDIAIISEYCSTHEEKTYVVHGSMYAFIQENSLYNIAMSKNVIYPGGWITNSPLYDEQASNNGIQEIFNDLLEKDNVVYLDKKEKECEILLEYYNSMQKGNVTYQKIDTVGNGYQIYEPLYAYNFFCNK
ncbi:hypothetical protein [Roseburia inulinivorans]